MELRAALLVPLAFLACDNRTQTHRALTEGGVDASGGLTPGGGGALGITGGSSPRGAGGKGAGGSPTDGTGGELGSGGGPNAGSGGARPSGGAGGGSAGGGQSAGDGGSWGTTALFFDDFLGSTLDAAKWSVFDRIGDQANGEVNCCVPANVSVSGGILRGVSKHEDRTCGDSQQAAVAEHYTSWQIQQKTAPFLYGTVDVRAKPPGGTGIWATIWMLGYEWQASQPFTANIPNHDWPKAGWCEIDIAEFWQNARSRVNCTVHFDVPGGLHEQTLPFDATTRFMVYRLEWTPGSLSWSVDAEDGAGFRVLRTVTGAGNVPDVAMYVVLNAAIGGTGGGTPDPSTFPQTFEVDWVRVSQ